MLGRAVFSLSQHSLAAVGLDPATARRIVQRVPWAWIHRASEHFTAATGAP